MAAAGPAENPLHYLITSKKALLAQRRSRCPVLAATDRFCMMFILQFNTNLIPPFQSAINCFQFVVNDFNLGMEFWMGDSMPYLC